mmetsp:Transcript_17009/g.50756  ORF Transcript_17009/g.50756 Transcript_17009/m.50756 type:complete len:229 (-) Transcript_17009:1081-1767(-)
MSAIAVSLPARSARTVSAPSQFTVPAVTLSPSLLSTGMGSPVSAASLTDDRPDATAPSTGMRSPGSTVSRSPLPTAAAGTSFQPPPPSDSRAVAGSSSCSANREDDAEILARCSRVRPSSTNASSIAGSSKNVPHASFGAAAATHDTPYAAHAPIATSEFMSGAPRRSAHHPSVMISRPGPSIAKRDRAAWAGGEQRCSSAAGMPPGQKCTRCPARQVAANATATISR